MADGILELADRAWTVAPIVHVAAPINGHQKPTHTTKPGNPVRKKLICTSTADILATTYEPIRWIVPDYVPEGFSVLAGRQKLGKTWLAIDWAIAVASGGHAMGSIRCEPGDALYLDFENGHRRIQRRIRSAFPGHRAPELARLQWAPEAPALDNGLLESLDEWRTTVAHPRLVVIDVLQRIKPVGNVARTSYENDYSAWAPLQSWAQRHDVAVLGLHHTRKGGADDPLEALSGSNGLSACADTTLVLDRDGNGITLYVRGRDVEEKETAMAFDAGLWSIKGDAHAVRISSERGTILKALRESGEPLAPADLAAETGMSGNNVKQLLFKMAKAGEVAKAGRGRYVHPDNLDNQVTDTLEGR